MTEEIIVMKVCSKCKVEKEVGEFYTQTKRGKAGLQHKCKQCCHDYYIENRTLLPPKPTDDYSSGFKTCTKCKMNKPLNAFGRRPDSRMKFKSWCNECLNKKYHADPTINHRKNYDCEEGMKVCHRCEVKQPLGNFGKNSDTVDKLMRLCKACMKEIYRSKHPAIEIPTPREGMKFCSTCGIEKTYECFSKSKRSLERGGDGLKERCKDCDKQYHMNNRDRILKRCRTYYHANVDKFKSYCESHKESISKASRIYRDAHKEYFTNYNKKYRIDNKEHISKRESNYLKTPEGKATVSRKNSARRSRLRNSKCSLTLKQWNKILAMQNNTCAVCGRVFNDKLKPERDHIIPLSLGGELTFGNTQALCRSCNSKKRNRIYIANAIENLLVEAV